MYPTTAHPRENNPKEHSNPRYDGSQERGGPELPGALWHSQYSEVGEDGTPSTSLYNRASVLIGDGVAIPEEGR